MCKWKLFVPKMSFCLIRFSDMKRHETRLTVVYMKLSAKV